MSNLHLEFVEKSWGGYLPVLNLPEPGDVHSVQRQAQSKPQNGVLPDPSGGRQVALRPRGGTLWASVQ